MLCKSNEERNYLNNSPIDNKTNGDILNVYVPEKFEHDFSKSSFDPTLDI